MVLSKPSIQERVGELAPEQNALIFHFRISANPTSEGEIVILTDLRDILERRGGITSYLGEGQCRLLVPPGLDWLPFLRTLQDCFSVELTDVTTLSQKVTLLLDDEDY